MLRPEEALGLARGTQPQVPVGAMRQGWHLTQDHDGKQLICLESVLRESLSGLEGSQSPEIEHRS